MRKLMMLAAAGVLFSGLALVKADDADKKVTIEGEGMCAKCALKETKTCQNAVIVTKDGKKETYYLVHEGVSKKATTEAWASARRPRTTRSRSKSPAPSRRKTTSSC